MIRQWLLTFAHDDKLKIAVIVLLLDFILGVVAAVKTKTFRLSYIYDFAKTDVLFKMVPWLAFYVLALIAGGTDIVIPGLDLGFVAGSMYALMLAAWVGSILSSLATLGIAVKLPTALTGGEKTVPQVPPPPKVPPQA